MDPRALRSLTAETPGPEDASQIAVVPTGLTAVRGEVAGVVDGILLPIKAPVCQSWQVPVLFLERSFRHSIFVESRDLCTVSVVLPAIVRLYCSWGVDIILDH